jgi:sugar-specific transcriptional regulator TrmB
MINLTASGLNETDTKIYIKLLEKKYWRPSELAIIVNENRTTVYKVLDKLIENKLVTKDDSDKTLKYSACNPTRLLEISNEKKREQENSANLLNTSVQMLLSEYVKNNEQPGVRYFQGIEGIEQIFADQVEDKQPIYFQLSSKAIDYYGFDKMHDLRMMAVNAGIPRYSIVADNHKATKNYAETDKQYLLSRTWLKQDDYTAPMEWGVYGNKLYILTFGKDAMGLIINSPAVADGFKQVYDLLIRLQKTQPYYHSLPSIASHNQPIITN